MANYKSRLSNYWRYKKSLVRQYLFKKLAHKGKYILADADEGQKFVVDPLDSGVSRQILRTGSYNREEFSRLVHYLSPSSRLLVVGGHIGAIALRASLYCKSVDVIEANPDTCALLRLNTTLNNCKNVLIHSNAVGAKSQGYASFLKNTENSGGSKILPVEWRDCFYYDRPEIVQVPLTSLDDLFETSFDVVLMDIEGSEYNAILGGRRILSEAEVLIIEFFPEHLMYVVNISEETFAAAIWDLGFSRALFPKLHREVCSLNEFVEALRDISSSGSSEDGIILSR